MGMAAMGKVYQEHIIIAFGGGANGKSTFWNTIFRVLGTYAGKISADTKSSAGAVEDGTARKCGIPPTSTGRSSAAAMGSMAKRIFQVTENGLVFLIRQISVFRFDA